MKSKWWQTLVLVFLFAHIAGCGGAGSGGGNSPFAGTGKVGTFECTYQPHADLKHQFDVVFDIDGDGRFVNGTITHRDSGQVMTDALTGTIKGDLSVVFEVKEGKVPGTSVHDIHMIASNTQPGARLVMEDGTPAGRCYVDLSAVEYNNTPQQFASAYYRLSWH